MPPTWTFTLGPSSTPAQGRSTSGRPQAGSCIQSCREGTRRKCGRLAAGPSSVLPPLSSCRSPVVRDRGSPSVGLWGSSEAHLAVCPLLCLSQPVYLNAPRRVHLRPVVLGGPLEDSCALCSLARGPCWQAPRPHALGAVGQQEGLPGRWAVLLRPPGNWTRAI